MQPALSQVCSLNAPFEQDIVDYAAGTAGRLSCGWASLRPTCKPTPSTMCGGYAMKTKS